MSTGLFFLCMVAAVALAILAVRALTRKAAPPPDRNSDRIRKATIELKRNAAAPLGQLDQLDTVPEGVPLTQLLADRQGPPVPPEALLRRAERLQERHTRTRQPEPMRALAKLLIDTVDAGLPDPYAFHDAMRVFLACAPEAVLLEIAPEAEARFGALTPWLEIDLSLAALRAARDRVPGPLDRVVALAEARRDDLDATRIDALLVRIEQSAAQGRTAAGDALSLASFLANRPGLTPRAVSEMAMHPGDPVWIAAWLMLEGRLLAAGHLSNIPAFRSRVMGSLRSEDAGLVAAAADAAEQLLDAEAAGDLSVLWAAVGGALHRFATPPRPLLTLADRLGIARPQAEA